MSMGQRRLISLFRTFIEKVFVPVLPKMDLAVQKQWNNFSKMINADTFNYGEVQLYVDTLSMPNQGIIPSVFDRKRNKSPINMTKKESSQENSPSINSFNPSKTFGGEKTRLALQMNLQENSNLFSRDSSLKQDRNISTQALMPALQKLFTLFSESQQKINKSSFMSPNSYYDSSNRFQS